MLEPFANAVFASLGITPFQQGARNIFLRDRKSGGLFILRLLNLFFLLLFCWKQA